MKGFTLVKKSNNRFFDKILMVAVPLLITLFSNQAAADNYSFGVVPQFEPRKLARIWLPILDRLQEITGHQFRLEGSPQIPEFEAGFMRERFDFAYMNPYHAMLSGRSQKYTPLVRDYSKKLFGVLVVKKDGPIKELAQLQGKTLAFPAPNALGASLLMRAELSKDHNLTFTNQYVKTHSSVYLHVLLGRASAGGGVMRTLKNQKPQYRDNLHVLHRTRGMHPHPVMANRRIPEEVKKAVKEAFLSMGKKESDKKLLAKIPIKQIGAASDTDYEPLGTWGLEEFYVGPNSPKPALAIVN
jgi:phosphonate transport system substrate-binding protein